jgi:hypothetical protein
LNLTIEDACNQKPGPGYEIQCGFFKFSAKEGTHVAEPFLFVIARSQAEVKDPGGPQLLGWESG